jgi:hypothetical protein
MPITYYTQEEMDSVEARLDIAHDDIKQLTKGLKEQQYLIMKSFWDSNFEVPNKVFRENFIKELSNKRKQWNEGSLSFTL